MPALSDFLEIRTRTSWGRALAEFADFCAPALSAVTLDIGCGPGLLPAILAERGCISLGLDLDLGLLKAGPSQGLCQADASQLPFPDESFDLVTSTTVMFLLDNTVGALREWRRVLKKSGAICLLNPSDLLSVASAANVVESRHLEGAARESLLAWAHLAESHARWTEAKTRTLLEAAGLELAESFLRVRLGYARLTRAERPK